MIIHCLCTQIGLILLTRQLIKYILNSFFSSIPSPSFLSPRNGWFVNLSSVSIPQNIQSFLQLTENFALPSGNKSQLIFDFIKCIENNKYKLPIDKRISFPIIPILNNLASSLIQHNEVDRKLLNLAVRSDFRSVKIHF